MSPANIPITRLHYGDNFIDLAIPEANLARVIRPFDPPESPDNRTLVRRALATESIESFRTLVHGRNLLILTADATRDMPLADILPNLLPQLAGCRSVRFLMCTGTHSPDAPQNRKLAEQIQQLATACGLPDSTVAMHDCNSPDLIDAGSTAFGTPIRYNPLLRDADAFFVLSDIKCHYFAGYSNPVKYFIPGACAFATAEKNHSLAMDDRSTYGVHPWHRDLARRDNPLAADQLAAMTRIVGDRPVFALTTVSSSGRIQFAAFGPAAQASANAFDFADQHNAHFVEPTDRLIVSCGGLPNDIDLYIAQRALELTQCAVADGGEILFLAACPGGIGEPHTLEEFYHRLTQPLDAILASADRPYRLFAHKPVKFARMIRRLRRIWMHTHIPAEQIAAAHLFASDNPQTVVDGWLAEDPAVRITVVDGANKLALYPQPV
jgi:nickel-dependent lactate racemase